MTYTQWPLRVMNGKTGGTYQTLANPKLVLHTTETKGLPNYEWPPHITFDPVTNTGWRHVDSNRSAYALRSPGGGRSPNYQAGPAFQIEIIAYARDTPHKTDTWYRNLARLIVEVCDNENIPPTFHPKKFTGSSAYGTDGVNRITWDAYRNFTGILGHQHVPFNTHWDPGALDTQRLISFMQHDQEDDMPLTDADVAKIWSAGWGDPNDPNRPTAGSRLAQAAINSAAALTIVKALAAGVTLTPEAIEQIEAEFAEAFGWVDRERRP